MRYRPDMIFIYLLSISTFIYYFVKIFTEQAKLPSFPRDKSKVGEDILRGLLNKCYFCSEFCSKPLWTLAQHTGMTDLASLVLFFALPMPIYVHSATPKDASITSAEVRKHFLFTISVFHAGLPKGSPHQSFSNPPFLKETWLEGIMGTSSPCPKNYIHKHSILSTISIQRQNAGKSSTFINHKVISLSLSSVSSRN